MLHKHHSSIVCLVLLLVAAAAVEAVASRQLDTPQQKQAARHGSTSTYEQLSYQKALANSSCHGFLIGIGTQKGGTTALWAYIADKAHPHLRVSSTKELGFWDNLHAKYAGCRIGDYLQLLAKGEVFDGMDSSQGSNSSSSSGSIQKLPICEALGASWAEVPPELLVPRKAKPWSSSSVARLLQSAECRINQHAGQTQSSAGARQGGPISAPTFATAGAGPNMATVRLLQQEGSAGPGSPMQAARITIRGAPAQLTLPPPGMLQPFYHADITPRYMFDPAVPPRIRAFLPEARIIVMLRDPVARAISNFNMWWQKQSAKPPAERPKASWSDMLAAQVDGEITRLSACFAAVGAAPITQPDLSNCLGLTHPYSSSYDEDLFSNRLLAQGLYAEQLQRWFALFPAESFLIWVSEDFKSDTPGHMQDLVRWLGLDMQQLDPKLLDPSTKMKSVHARRYEGHANAEVVARMRRFFEPHNTRLFELLDTKGFGAVAARLRQVWSQ